MATVMYMSDDELLKAEQLLKEETPVLGDVRLHASQSLALKIGIALGREWALEKQAAKVAARKGKGKAGAA